MMPIRPNVLFLVGPTGSGKSDLAVALAKILKGEIVSCDSMLVYRGMDIGTAKPDPVMRKKIRHHVLDLISPAQSFSVEQYRRAALKAIQNILKHGKVPIVAGGSGLYIESLIDGLAPHKKINPSIRKCLAREVQEKGLGVLYERLCQMDPERAKEILPGDERRILRALEIYEAFGLKPSEWRKKRIGLSGMGYRWLMVGLMRDRQELYRRIHARVDEMVRNGFLNEVKGLSKTRLSLTARQAIGYLELLHYFRGDSSLEDAVEATKKRTRHLAKKQIIWFRRENRISWLNVRGNSHMTEAKRRAVKLWRSFCEAGKTKGGKV